MKASSESGECASLISSGSFLVFEAVCWPGMGVLGSSFRAARRGRGNLRCAPELTGVDSPRLGFPQKRLPPLQEALSGVGGRKLARSRGLRGAWPGDSYKGKPSISQAIATNAGLLFHRGATFRVR